MLKKFLHNQRGQMLILYALLTPLLFCVGGAAVDLGWYYLNVSRLHNMVDSAIIASATVLTKPDNEFSNYRYSYFLPKAPENLTVDENKESKSGDLEAKKYISKNLEISSDWIDKDSVTDTVSDVELNFSRKIFPTKDADGYPILYYEITLTETPKHFFSFFDSFGDMPIVATAAAKFTYVPDDSGGGGGTVEHGPSLFDQMEDIKKSKVYDYWEVIQNEYREEANKLKADIDAEVAATGADREEVLQRYIVQLAEKYMERGINKNTAISRATDDLTKDRSANRARERSVTTSGNWWLADLTNYRTENMTLRGIGGNSWNENQMDFDDLFINALQDVRFAFKEDWDIPEPLPSGMKKPDNFINSHVFGSDKLKEFRVSTGVTDPDNLRLTYRIFTLIGVEEERDKPKGTFPYKVREGRDKYDPLFARIESEPIKWEEYYSTDHKDWNSVRQFFINVNCANSKEGVDRPIIFFYDGPRKIDENSHIRDSKPIIFNLNADFRGVIYAPNSPVVVAGNGKKFEGFVVAKKFLKLKTDKEFEAEGLKKVVRKDNGHDVYVAEENIKFSETETLPEKTVAVTYEGGEAGKFYYIERKDRDFSKESEKFYFEKISTVFADSKYNPVKIPEMFVDNNGDVQFSNEVFATVAGTDKARGAETPDKIYATAADFGLSSSTFNNFFVVKFVNYTYLNQEGNLDNFFTTERSKHVD